MKQRGRNRLVRTIAAAGLLPALLTLQLVVAPGADADPGDLDPAFGNGGIATLIVPDQVLHAASALGVQSDGKIVTAGALASSATSPPDKWVIHRFLPDGTVDFAFGDGSGYVTYAPDTSILGTYVTDLVVQSDGGIVVAGFTEITAGIANVYVERFDSTGGTDDTFGGTGPVVFSPASRNLGGELALQPGASAGDPAAIVLGAWAEGTNPFFLTRLLPGTGAMDPTFAGDGVAEVDFGVRAVLQDIFVQPDRKILASGHIRNGAPLDNAGIARLLPDGVADPGFGGFGVAPTPPGSIVYDLIPGSDDHATVLSTKPDGTIVVGGNSFGPRTAQATLAEIAPNGASLVGSTASASMFDAADVTSAVGAVAVDADGATYLFGSGDDDNPDSSPRAGVKRFNGLTADPVFGSQTFLCSGTTAQAGVIDDAGRALVSSGCGGFTQTVARYLTVPSVPALANIAWTVTPSSAAAQALALPISSLDRADFADRNSSPLNSSPLNSSPLNSSPLNSSPLNSSPLNSSPLNSSPLNSSPLNSSAFPPTLLSEIPLRVAGGWESILAETALAGIPDNARTIQQVFALNPAPAGLSSLTLAHIPLNSSPLNTASLAAVLYGNTPVVRVGTPFVGAPQGTSGRDQWCTFLAPMRFNCTNGVNPDVTPLWALELKGDELGAFYRSDIEIFAGTPDPGSPLMTLRLSNIEQSVVPTGGITYAAAPGLFSCPSATGCAVDETLARAQASAGLPDVSPTATVADLRSVPEAESLSLSALIVGLIPAEDFPWETISLSSLFAQAGFAGDSAEYQLAFDLVCEQSDGLSLRFNLPNGARYIPGSFTIDFGAATYNPPIGETFSPTPAPSPSGPSFGDPSEDEGGLFYAEFGSPACTSPTSNTPVTVTARLRALTPPNLGVEDASASVRVNAVPALRVTGASLETFDGPESNNDTFETAVPIDDDVLYTGFISSKSDVDVWRFTAPTAGSEMTIFASHLPADFDFAVFGPRLPDSRSAPLNSSPLNSSPLNSSPLNSSPLEDQGGYSAPGGADIAPDTIQDSPLNSSPLNSSPLNSSPLNSSTLRGSGVQRGIRDEVITLTITEEDAGQTFYLAGVGYNGASATSPYLVRMKTTAAPPDLPCVQRSFGTGGASGADVPVAADRETLFLVNQKRFGDAYGKTETDAMMAKLRSLAALAEVKGVVLSVESNAAVANAYAAWDRDVCSVKAPNAVVDALASFVDTKRSGVTGLRHLVLVGSDEMLPFYRVPDLVTLSNQKDYAEPAALSGLDNPLSRAYRRGYVITDDKIGDFDPMNWFGGKLFAPDVGIGRVVESPAEIIRQADRVLGIKKVSPPMKSVDVTTSSFTAGYDFLRDGAQEIDQTLRSRAPSGPSSKISETWTAQDITGALNANPRVSTVLAHYDHYRALPAANNLSANSPTPLFNATDLRSSALAPGALLFTLGCQSGMNIADTLVTLGPDHPDAKKEADWAQVATGEKLLTYAANTGFGYGDTEVVAYSERLFGNFARGLDGQATVGQAFALAKSAYIAGLGGLPKVGVYDHKLLSEATFYGWPFLRVGSSGLLAPSFVPQPAPAAPAAPTMRTRAFDESMTFNRVNTTRGSYWTELGQSLITEHFRPIQPMHTLDVTPTDGFKVNGVWFDVVRFRDIGASTGIDPHLSIPTVDLSSSSPEPALGDIAFPAALSNFGTAPTATGRKTTLMLLTGQSASTANLPPGLVVQRLFTRLAGEVARTDGNNFTPPQLRNMTAGVLGSLAAFRAETPDADVSRMRVFYTDDTATPVNGDITFKTVDLAPAGGGAWSAAVTLPPNATRVTQWWVQAQRISGATGTSNNKVAYYTAESQPPTTGSGLVLTVSPTPTASGFYATTPTITVTPPAGEPVPSYEQRVDGAAFAPYTGPITVTGDGYHQVDVRGSDGSFGTASMVVDTGRPTVRISVPFDGQSFAVGQAVTAQFTCADAGSGIASCVALDPLQLNTSEGEHTFRVRATDNVGNTTTVSHTYYGGKYLFEGFFSPVENPNVYNKAKPGSSIPVKFRVRDRATNAIASALSTVGSIVVTNLTCPADAIVVPIAELDLSTSGLKFDQTEQRFHYTWKTALTWNGCKKLTITLDDGMKRFAYFDFRK